MHFIFDHVEPGTEEIEHDGVPPTTLNHPSIITTNPNLNYVDRFSPNLKNAASLWINPITSSVITAKAKIESVAGPKCEPVAGKPLAKLDPHLDANSYKKPSGIVCCYSTTENIVKVYIDGPCELLRRGSMINCYPNIFYNQEIPGPSRTANI